MHGAASVSDRFEKSIKVNEESGCWIWQQSSCHGYGRFYMNGKRFLAHRASYEIHRGPVPDGMFVCHKCDNPMCVRPDHLFLGSGIDNVADRDSKRRQARGERIKSAKLTASEALEIKAAKGVSVRNLSERYGVGLSQIREIRSGKWWRDISVQGDRR